MGDATRPIYAQFDGREIPLAGIKRTDSGCAKPDHEGSI